MPYSVPFGPERGFDMKFHLKKIISKHLKMFTALVISIVIFCLTQPAQITEAERIALAEQFSFTRKPLQELPVNSMKKIRLVHPELQHHAAWTSSVGASVALNDLDQDGLSNDVCHVDPRTDKIIISPAENKSNRYKPFTLEPESLHYDQLTMAPMGCLPGDLNEDGINDILVYYWGRTPIAFLNKQVLNTLNPSLNSNSYLPQEIVFSGERWHTNAATLSDLDGDGHTDLVFGNYHQDGAKILDASATNHDEMQHSMTRAQNGGSTRFFLWKGSSQGGEPSINFSESKQVLDDKISHGWTLAVGAADLDGDLLPELYFANDFGPDRLLHNRSKAGELRFSLLEGRKSFTTPNSKVLGRDSFKGMGVDFGDINRDGLLDIYVSNIAAEYALEESHFMFVSSGDLEKMDKGVAPYVDRSEQLGLSRSGWGWETKLADFNNDGNLEAIQATGFVKGQVNRWPELHELAMGNDELLSNSKHWPQLGEGDDLSGHQHNPFFVQAKNGRYYDLAKELQIDTTEVSRGIATADVDGDGDLDFAVANQWEPSYFYQNNSSNLGNSLDIHLLRSLSPGASASTTVYSGHSYSGDVAQPAIGAMATVHLPNGQKLVAQVDGGNGHSGARSPDLHFGLDRLPKNTLLKVDLHWRDIKGITHLERLTLIPGWHTIVLGQNTSEEV
jgi:enediyne biosynthesis protein E4